LFNEVIFRARVKAQMGLERLTYAKDKISVILCPYSKKLSVPGMV